MLMVFSCRRRIHIVTEQPCQISIITPHAHNNLSLELYGRKFVQHVLLIGSNPSLRLTVATRLVRKS